MPPIAFALAIAFLARTAGAQATFVFDSVNVIPMDRRDAMLRNQRVVVEGDRIVAVRAASDIPIPAGAQVIDGRGKFLIPGLGDAHVHLSAPGGGAALARRALELHALHGVTMIRSMYTEPHHREAVASLERGDRGGPRTVLVSPAFTGHSTPTWLAARDSLTRWFADGYRVAKILPGLSRETFDTIVVHAKRLGMTTAGHVPAAVGLEHALASGLSTIEHLDGFLEAMAPPGSGASGFFGLGVLAAADESRIAPLVAATKRAGATVVPTEVAMETYVTTDSGGMLRLRPEMRYVPPTLREQWVRQKDGFTRGAAITPERAERYRELRRRVIRELHAAGVPLALGSDAFSLFDVPGAGVFDELSVFVASGLSPWDALRSATVEVARLLSLPRVTGMITVGSTADLVLLEGDPLADIENVRRRAGVMLRGTWRSRVDLDRQLETLVAR